MAYRALGFGVESSGLKTPGLSGFGPKTVPVYKTLGFTCTVVQGLGPIDLGVYWSIGFGFRVQGLRV